MRYPFSKLQQSIILYGVLDCLRFIYSLWVWRPIGGTLLASLSQWLMASLWLSPLLLLVLFVAVKEKTSEKWLYSIVCLDSIVFPAIHLLRVWCATNP
jgi:hypothetical protein